MAETSLKDLKVDPKNARKHNSRNIGLIESSLRKVGAARSGVIDENGVILAGNGTYEALARAGIEKVKVIEAEGNEWVVVKRTGLTDQQKRELALADNRAAELAEWDGAVLKAQGIDLAPWFTDQELRKIGAGSADVGDGGPDPQLDRAEALRKQYGIELGQVWQLGEHRLMCGDSTKGEDVRKVLAETQPDILITDPPYSSGGFQEAGRSSGSIGTRQNVKIASDQLSTRGYLSLMGEVLDQINADVLYLFTDWRMWSWTYDIAERKNYPVRNMLVWDKGQMGMGFPWRSTHELILFAKRTPSQMLDGKHGNVLRFDRTGNVNHPTEKPTELISTILENTLDGTVYDPFLGSGTTLIACEQLNRRCYAMEISPAYVAVAIQRWVDLTGKEPKLL